MVKICNKKLIKERTKIRKEIKKAIKDKDYGLKLALEVKEANLNYAIAVRSSTKEEKERRKRLR